jgi:hypothetical protein
LTFQHFVERIEPEESNIAQFMSLQKKFCSAGEDCDTEMTNFLCDLLLPKEVEVPGGPSGSFGAKIKAMFLDAQRVSILLINLL